VSHPARADPDRDGDEQERDDERKSPAPIVERLDAQNSPDADDGLQVRRRCRSWATSVAPGVVSAMLVLDVLGDIRDGAAVLSPMAEALDQSQRERMNAAARPIAW